MSDQQYRRLAAILAADIVGYSALMGTDEEATVRDLKGHQAVVLPMIDAHGGRIIATAGDGILAEFASAINAVKCAVAIQREMEERNALVAQTRRMLFRIGVNLGDLIYDETNVYGDGINVAARLESIADPGGICVSHKVYQEMRGKMDVASRDIGLQTLKNISEPVRVYRIHVGSSANAAPGGMDRRISEAKQQQSDELPAQRVSGSVDEKFGRARCILPTTGGIVWIEGIRARKQLKASYASLKGDFRPLGMSQDYARFVSGPLVEYVTPGPYELSLSGTIDSGRSWELPVMLAHLLHAQGKLTDDGSVAGPNCAAGSPPARIIWATGMVNTDLTPLVDTYHVARKLELADQVFAEALAQAAPILMLLPRGLAQSERLAAQKVAQTYGASLHEVGSLHEVKLAIGVEAGEEGQSERIGYEKSVESAQWRWREHRHWLAASVLLLVGVAAIVSGGSILWREGGAGERGSLLVEESHADSEDACQEAILRNSGFILRPLGFHEGAYRVGAVSPLCGLFFRNIGRDNINVRVDPQLRSYGILGDNPLFSGIELGANQSIPLFFSRRPPAGVFEFVVTFKSGSQTERQVQKIVLGQK